MESKFYRILRQTLLLPLCAIIFLPAADLFAAPIDRNSAAKTASEFLNSRQRVAVDYSLQSHGKSTDFSENLVDIVETDAYYVFTTSSERGFVIVAADDGVSPVVGYSDDGVFDADSLPPALAAYLSDYSKVAEAISSGKVKYQRTTRGGQIVGPLMTVKWNQDDPYNRLTPVIGSERTYTGCVATAIAQVMKYHNFPEAGRGVAGENNYRKIELGHAYGWDDMLDEYVDGSFSDAQADAVATLMRDVGYAVNMEYGTDASSAATANIPAAMCRYFNYSPEIKYVFRSCYSTQAWIDEIRASLLRAEPVLYGGVDGRNSGHQFICDGIDSDDMLHINWGWGGYGDGFFDMNILSPEYLGIGSGEGAYYREQDMIINIRPGDPSADYLGWRAPMTIDKVAVSRTTAFDENGRYLPDEGSDFGISFQATNSTGFKVEYYSLAFAVMISDESGNPVGVYNPSGFGSLEAGYYRPTSVNIGIMDLISRGIIRDGRYSLSVVVIPNDKKNDPKPSDILPLNSGDLNCVRIRVEGGNVYLEDLSMLREPKYKLMNVRTDGNIYCQTGGKIILTVFNTSSIAREEESFVYLVHESEDKPDIDLNNYLSYAAGKIFAYPDTERDVTLEYCAPEVPGRYRVYVTNYSYATSAYMALPSDSPLYLDVKELPADEICMVSSLKLNKQSYCRNSYIRLGVDFSYNNPGPYFTTDIELWARLKNNPDGNEFLLLKKSGQKLYSGSGDFSTLEWSEQDVVWYEDLGEYEAYVKYTDADGNLKVMAGEDNHADFTLTASDYIPYAELSAPMVINKGNSVEAVDWTYFDVEAEIMSPTGMTIVENSYSSVDVHRSPRSGHWLYSFTTAGILFDKTVLAPGEKTKIHARLLYRAVDEEPDLIGNDLYVQFNSISTEDGNCRVHPGAFVNSTGFKLVEDVAGIDGVLVDGSIPTVVLRPGGLTVSDINEGSTVGLYTLDGRCAVMSVADNSSKSIDGVAGGIYLLRVTARGGKQFTTKVVIR